MKHYQVLSAVLLYPEQALLDNLDELEQLASDEPEFQDALQPLFSYFKNEKLIDLQQNYVATFDRNMSHSLHLFEHIHGESRDRGQAMVDLMEEYKKYGLEMCANDLPDYVPLFLEFLSQVEDEQAARMLGDAIHVLAYIGGKLRGNQSPYAGVFDMLQMLSPVVAEELAEPPVRDMDEAMETFGSGIDGVEPLLKTFSGGPQPVNFYPKARLTAAQTAAATSAG